MCNFALIYRVIRASSVNYFDRLLSIIVKWVYFRVKTCFLARYFVTVSCVFMHIAGSIFIFNISLGHRSASDLDQRVGEPPQWGAFRKSTSENPPQAGIFHLRHEPQIFVPRVLTPEFCPAELVGWTGWASRRRETCART